MHIRSAAIRCNRLPARSAAIRCAPPLQLSAQIRCRSAPYGPAHGVSPPVSHATSAQIRCNPRIPLHGLPQSVAPRVMPSARNVCLNPLQQLHADAVRPQNRPAVYTPRGLCPRDPRQRDIAPLHSPLRACAKLGPGDHWRRATLPLCTPRQGPALRSALGITGSGPHCPSARPAKGLREAWPWGSPGGPHCPSARPAKGLRCARPRGTREGRLSDGVPPVRGCRGRASSPCRGPGQRPGGPPEGPRVKRWSPRRSIGTSAARPPGA